jgi:hypothetical protein
MSKQVIIAGVSAFLSVLWSAMAGAQGPSVQTPDYPNITVPRFYPWCQQRPPDSLPNDPYLTAMVYVDAVKPVETNVVRFAPGWEVAQEMALQIVTRLEAATPDLQADRVVCSIRGVGYDFSICDLPDVGSVENVHNRTALRLSVDRPELTDRLQYLPNYTP